MRLGWCCCDIASQVVTGDDDAEYQSDRTPEARLTEAEASRILIGQSGEHVKEDPPDEARRRWYYLRAAASQDGELKPLAPPLLTPAPFEGTDLAYHILATSHGPFDGLTTQRTEVLPTRRMLVPSDWRRPNFGSMRNLAVAAAANNSSATNGGASNGGARVGVGGGGGGGGGGSGRGSERSLCGRRQERDWDPDLRVAGLRSVVIGFEQLRGEVHFILQTRYAGLPPIEVRRSYNDFLDAEAALEPLLSGATDFAGGSSPSSFCGGGGGFGDGGGGGGARGVARVGSSRRNLGASGGRIGGGGGGGGSIRPLQRKRVAFEKSVPLAEAKSRRAELQGWLMAVLAHANRRGVYVPGLFELAGVTAAAVAEQHRADMLALKEELEGWPHCGSFFAVSVPWHRAWLEFLTGASPLAPGPIQSSFLATEWTSSDRKMYSNGSGGTGGGRRHALPGRSRSYGGPSGAAGGGGSSRSLAAPLLPSMPEGVAGGGGGGALASLRPGLQLGRDYEVVPVAVWRLMCMVYGSDDTEVAVEADPLSVRNLPTVLARSASSFISGGGGARTRSISGSSDSTGFSAPLRDSAHSTEAISPAGGKGSYGGLANSLEDFRSNGSSVSISRSVASLTSGGGGGDSFGATPGKAARSSVAARASSQDSGGGGFGSMVTNLFFGEVQRQSGPVTALPVAVSDYTPGH